MTQSLPAICAKNLTKRFGELEAVKDLSLTIYPGEIFGIVGPDGAGKSTTLRMLASIMDPSSGSASIVGYDVSKDAVSVKDHMAYMAQRFSLYQDLTVFENIRFYADLYGVPRKGRGARIDELLDFSHMRPFKKRRAGNLSGGMKQKLQLVCALIHTPKVLLLDEPTNGVDPVSRRDFWRILYKLLKQDVSILVTTAYLDEAERCNRVGLLDHGKLFAQGTPAQIKALMKGKILAIRSPKARNINKLARRELICQSANVFGDTVHLVCPDSDENTISELKEKTRQMIEKNGLKYDTITEIVPSLEDVFVNVLDTEESSQDGSRVDDSASIVTPGFKKQDKQDKSEQEDTAVRVRNLTRRFGDFVAVDNLSFNVSRGEIFGFLGPNGAGKSTTIRMLCGLLTPSEGNGDVAGYDVRNEAEKIKQHIGYMSQKFSLYEDLTVSENIDFYGGIYGLNGNRLKERKHWAVDMAGLREHRHSLTRILSGGWKQRLALACAILHEPPIIFLDEPTSGVDPVSRRRFWDLIYEMAEHGITVFVTTHYMEEAEYCDRIALIYGGKMIAMGTPGELKTEYMQEEILDLRCAKPQEIREDLTQLPLVKDAALFGAGLHIVTQDAESAKPQIRQFLEQRNIAVEQLATILPSMEDVFVSLIEQVDRDLETAKQEEAAS